MNDSGAFIVKFEFEFFEVTQGMADTFVIFFFDVKEQKAPSSSPKQFAAGSAVLHGEVIIPVDQLVGDAAGEFFFIHPALMKNVSHRINIIMQEFFLQRIGQPDHFMQIFDFLPVVGRVLFLLFQNISGSAGLAGVKHQEIVLQPFVPRRGEENLFNINLAAGLKSNEIQPAASAGILVLLANRFSQQVNFHMAGLLGNVFFVHIGFVVGIAEVYQPGSECRR